MQLLQLIDRKYIKYVISQGEITVEDNKLTKIKELDAYILINRQFKRLKSLYNNRQY
jgi:hypothetical protein